MSKLEETIYCIENIVKDSNVTAYQLLQCSNKLANDTATLSNISKGTNDPLVQTAKNSFITAAKALSTAAKTLMVGAEAGQAWCDGQHLPPKRTKARR